MGTVTEEQQPKKKTALELYREQQKKLKEEKIAQSEQEKRAYKQAQVDATRGNPKSEEVTNETPKLLTEEQQPEMEETTEQEVATAEPQRTYYKPKNEIVEISKAELDYGIDPTKTYVFEPVVKSQSPRHEMIGTECKIFDGSRIRIIRYVPMADTIFVDEMGDKFKDYQSPPLSFHNNQLSVSGTDARLVEYMLTHDAYDGNKHPLSPRSNKFMLVNKADLELTTELAYKQELKAMNIINDSDISELLPIARVVHNITDLDPRAVKNQLRAIAKVKPHDILDHLDSPIVRRSYVIQVGLDRGIIEYNPDKRSMVWPNGGGLIKEMFALRNPTEQLKELADYTFSTQGNKFYDILKIRVSE